MLKFILSSVLFNLSEGISIERSCIVTTASGTVKGKLNEFNAIEFYSYQGIPYAENPTGKMRFKPPVPRKSWSHILDATKEGAVCFQLPKFYNLKDMTEDCLNINVYVPKNEANNLLPVMVFIHGGALQYLSGRIDKVYGPQFILGREIVYVSMNYRLGPFGFLSLDMEEASGNSGLKDILLSLKWIKQNIKHFGGDSDKITVAGHSSGSLIINLLLLTKQSDGLFNQAILMSGSAFAPRSILRHPKDISIALAKELGIVTNNVSKTLKILQEIDAPRIISAYYNMSKTYDSPLRTYAPFMPSREVASNHALFVMDPTEAVRKNILETRNIPLLVGITSQEAINMIPHVKRNVVGVKKICDNPEYLIPSNIEYPLGSQRSKNLAKLLIKMYFEHTHIQKITLQTLIEFMSDIQNIYGVYFWIEKYRTLNTNSLFLYMFNFNGNLNINPIFFKTSVKGIGHGDDVPYVFVANATRSLYNSIDEKSRRMMNRMIGFISNFVYYGNPTPENLNNELLWPDYVKEQNFLILNDNPAIERFSLNPIYPRMQFWDKVYKEYFEYLDNGGQIEKKILP